MPLHQLTINGESTQVDSEPDRSLLEVLREDLELTGTKYGCGEGECGACTVHVDGKAAHSCQTPIGECAGRSVRTIEGLADGESLHPIQQAFLDANAFQCGYCTAGMVMGAAALLDESPSPTDDEIAQAMNGNICRCCGYLGVIEAIKAAATGREAAK